jgi:hypothetical protein
MMKLCLLAAAAGTLLVSATPPVSSGTTATAGSAYPPCSRKVTDHCTQTNERAARAATASAGDRQSAAPPAAIQSASAGTSDYPPCSATVRDRCTQTRAVRGNGRRSYAMRRAGERG